MGGVLAPGRGGNDERRCENVVEEGFLPRVHVWVLVERVFDVHVVEHHGRAIRSAPKVPFCVV